MRLIDADALKKNSDITVRGETIGKREYVMHHEIDDAPTIDAVEVVRCRDCNYGIEERNRDYRCWLLDEDWYIRFSPRHFWSYGKRREDGEA